MLRITLFVLSLIVLVSSYSYVLAQSGNPTGDDGLADDTKAPANDAKPEAPKAEDKKEESDKKADAKPVVKAPTKEIARGSCVTAQCHADVKSHKVLHGPLNVDACDACHKLVDAKKHEYKLTRDPDKLCAFCHKTDLAKGKVVHEPVKKGKCIDCHDSHGGFDRNFLKKSSMKELCASCHKNVIGNKKHVHGPVAAGACGACHMPHSAENKNLLTNTGRELCLNCHQDMARQLKNTKFVHAPVANDDCSKCHDAHASNHKMMIHSGPEKLCTESCHEPIKHAISKAKFQHSAVTQGDACTNCHTSHGGDLAGLMKNRPIDLCMECHAKPIKTESRTVAAIDDLTKEGMHKHGPVNQGSCGGCHNVHGSDVSRLLTKAYPETFYTSYKDDQYALCFSCHDKQLVELRTTKGLTGFRDGEVNMHYLHVHKAKRGRSCRACHTTHTSKYPMGIRDSVPYGNWEMPINYKPTKNGGTCTPGCHQELGYDRTKSTGGDAE